MALLSIGCSASQSDIEETQKELAATQAELAQVKTELVNALFAIQSTLDGLTNGQGALTDTTASVAAAQATLSESLRTLNTEVAALNSTLTAVQVDLDSTKRSLASLTSELDDLKSSFLLVRDDVAANKEAIAEIQTAQEEIDQTITQLQSDVQFIRGTGALTLDDLENAKYGGVLTGIQYRSPQDLDPVFQAGQYRDALMGGLFNRLLRWNPFNPTQSVPDLATGWEVDPTGRVYTFALRDDVAWHDSVPFTAHDVVATWDYYINTWLRFSRESRLGGLLLPLIQSYRAVDNQTFEATLVNPSSTFIPIITSAQFWVLPKHFTEPSLAQDSFIPIFTGDGKPPTGTGPFKYKKWLRDVNMEWERNPDYWRKDPLGNSLPYLDGYQGVVVSDNNTQFAAFKAGQVDFWPNFPLLSAEQVQDVKASLADEVTILEGSSSLLDGNVINLDWKYGRERDFRWAIALIMDQEEFKAGVYGGNAEVGRILDPRVFPTFALPQEEVDTSPWMVQPKDEAHAEARRLLAGLGITEATPLELRIVCRNTHFHCAEAEVLASQLSEFGGLNPRVEVYDPRTGSARVRDGLFELNTQTASITVQDPLTPIQRRFQADVEPRPWILPNGQPDPDRLRINQLTQQAATELDPEKQKQLIWDIQRVIYFQDLPIVPLGYPSMVVPVWDFVKGHCVYGGLYECQSREYTWLDR